MKNKKISITLMTLILVLVGCQTEDISTNEIENQSGELEITESFFLNDKTYIETASIAERLAYTEFHLSTLMEGVLEVNPNFEEMEEFKSAKGETPTFYLENLLISSQYKKNGKSVSSNSKAANSIGAFEDIEGESWYPIIKKLKSGSGNGKDAVYLINSFDEIKGMEYVRAFIVNENGNLELSHSDFSEEMYSVESESGKVTSSFYQLTLSDCGGDGPMLKSASCGGGGGGGGTSTSYRLKTINIKDKKESWLERADISQIVVHWPFFDPNTYHEDIFYSIDGTDIRKVKTSELNKNLSVDSYITGRSGNSGVLEYLIFEHDNFPATKQKSTFYGPQGTSYKLTYRSWNKKYDHQLLYINQAVSGVSNISNFSKSKNEIYYQIR